MYYDPIMYVANIFTIMFDALPKKTWKRHPLVVLTFKFVMFLFEQILFLEI